MKYKCFAINAVVLLIAASCSNHNSSVNPSPAILTSFASRFGTEKRVKWELSEKVNYQATFKHDGHPAKAYFDANGTWQKTETELLTSEIPSVVVKTIVTAFKGNTITRTLLIEKSGEETIYRLFLKRGGEDSTCELSPGGVILNNPMIR